jgi:hypothetical protein
MDSLQAPSASDPSTTNDRRRQFPPNEVKEKTYRKIGDVGVNEVRNQPASQYQRFHLDHRTQNKTGAKDVGNSTSSAPAMSNSDHPT